MHPIRFVAWPAIAAGFVACAPQKDNYDTAASHPAGPAATAPYHAGDANVNAPYDAAATAPANPVYDTPAAYEDATGAKPPVDPAAAAATTAPRPGNTAHATAPAAGGTVHVVVKGDTLSGIAAKYKVPSASIKAANNMTKDTVVLGKKLIIPAR